MKKKISSLLVGMCMVINLLVPIMSEAEEIDVILVPTPPAATAVPTTTEAPDAEDDFEEIPMPTVPVVTPSVELATEAPIEYPDPLPYSWEVSSEYNGCPAGTELMVGLTTLFDNTCDNGKYISGVDSGNWSNGAATGLALRYAPTADGVLTVSFIQLGSRKSVVANIEGGEKNSPLAVVANDGLEKISGDISIEVEAGKVYYVYGAGTKARLTAAYFDEGAELEATPTPSPTATPTPTPVPTATPEITATPGVTESPKTGEIIITTDEPIIIIPLEPTEEPLCSSPGPDVTPEPTPPGGLCSSPGPDVTPNPTDEPLCSSPGPEVTENPKESGDMSNAGSGAGGGMPTSGYVPVLFNIHDEDIKVGIFAEDPTDITVYVAIYREDGRLVQILSRGLTDAYTEYTLDVKVPQGGGAKLYMWRNMQPVR